MGLGPGGLEGASEQVQRLLHSDARLFARTVRHPAVEELTATRVVETGDDLYASSVNFEEVYEALATRVVEAATNEDIVFAVPGSPFVGEFTVPVIKRLAGEAGLEVEVIDGLSFIDAMCDVLAIDPLESGLQILDARDLPDPLILALPTIIAQTDLPVVLADVADRLSAILPPDAVVTVMVDAGSSSVMQWSGHPDDLDSSLAGLRTSLFVYTKPGGIVGAIDVMRQLRQECLWDQSQTHHSLIPHLIEESFELADALSALPTDERPGELSGAYGDVEEELGDVLLQVLFHATIGEENGTMHIDEVAETLRRKLVRRHPHVFGEVEAATPDDALAAWEQAKAAEKGPRDSIMDGVPTGLPAGERAMKLSRRAAKFGFDWAGPSAVLDKVREEVGELESATTTDESLDEFGDLLLALVNLARHLDISPEVALRRASDKFERRFRHVEAQGPLDGLTPLEQELRWQLAKQATDE